MSETGNVPVLTIDVKCKEAYGVKGQHLDVVMIPFTGTADGPYFRGEIIGTGVDTQKIPHGKNAFLSARYMLEGQDFKGQKCRIFIENQGEDLNCCTPIIVTDSQALSELEDALLKAVVKPVKDGVIVNIYKDR